MWADAHLELSRLLTEEMPIKSPEPEPDRVVFFQRVAVRYVRYLKLFRQLEKVYDQVVHPQKRRAIRPVLDGVMGRLLELKFDMVETEFSEYHYLDDILHDMKLTPVSVMLRPEVIGVIVVSFEMVHSPGIFVFLSSKTACAGRPGDPHPSLLHQRTWQRSAGARSNVDANPQKGSSCPETGGRLTSFRRCFKLLFGTDKIIFFLYN